MRYLTLVLACLLSGVSGPALAWGNHTVAAYRAFEKMPEVLNAAPVLVEPLETFLKAEEKPIEALLLSQEAWAVANLSAYAPRPAALTFTANPSRPDDARRLAFLMALRIAPTARFALYFQPDPRTPIDASRLLAHTAVDTLPESPGATQRFIGLKAGEPITPLRVLASAADEPDYGLDINLWQNSPSEWGKVYGFGSLPFGNPALSYSTQAPFHMGFFHEDRVLYMAAPFLRRTFPLLRAHQYAGLAALAFRTGHPYWGWRFTGLSLHYVQDLTQPYHASVSPGGSTLSLIFANALAMAGMPGKRDDLVVLLSNRHLALERYQTQLLQNAALTQQDTPFEKALRDTDGDARYPPWSDAYLRDVVAREAYDFGPRLLQALVAAIPPGLVSDPAFDFGAHESSIDLVAEIARQDPAKQARLDAAVAELLGHFGAHSRNAVRGILKSGRP
jgi:hypothetical protein